MVNLAPLTAPKILVTSNVEYAYTTLGPGQIFFWGVFSIFAAVVVDIMVVVVEVADDSVVVVVVVESEL